MQRRKTNIAIYMLAALLLGCAVWVRAADPCDRACLESTIDQVLEAMSGREALAVLEQHGEEVQLILSDVVMPGMSGITLLHALREKGLKVPVVMLTGHPVEKELEDLRGQGLTDWLLKPLRLEQLAGVIARALGAD